MVNARATFALVALLGVSTASVVQLCQKTTCTYTDIGNGLFRTTIQTNNEENFKCGKGEGLTCDCWCADHFKCTLDHHVGDGDVQAFHHCEAITPAPTPFPTPEPTAFPTPAPTLAPPLKHGDVIGLFGHHESFLGIDSSSRQSFPYWVGAHSADNFDPNTALTDYEGSYQAYFRVGRSGSGFTLKNIKTNTYLTVTDGGVYGSLTKEAGSTLFVQQDGNVFALYASLPAGKTFIVSDGNKFFGSVRTSYSSINNPWLSFRAVQKSYPYEEDGVYTLSNKKVFFVKSTKGTLEVPKDFRNDACRSMGASVCSWNDIDDTQKYAQGNYCACSYISDGGAFYPMQPYSGYSGCGPTTGGLNSCGYWMTKANVCCVVHQ